VTINKGLDLARWKEGIKGFRLTYVVTRTDETPPDFMLPLSPTSPPRIVISGFYKKKQKLFLAKSLSIESKSHHRPA
jgi:hypothetical protein